VSAAKCGICGGLGYYEETHNVHDAPRSFEVPCRCPATYTGGPAATLRCLVSVLLAAGLRALAADLVDRPADRGRVVAMAGRMMPERHRGRFWTLASIVLEENDQLRAPVSDGFTRQTDEDEAARDEADRAVSS